MDTKTMINQLKCEAEKHKNDSLFTGQTNITALCNDVIPKLEKLEEYETAEEEGRLVVLPCKSGQDLFGIYNGAIVDGYADGYLMEKTSVHSDSEHWIWFQYKYSKVFWKVSFDDFGKKVFFTREEAEKALKEMEGKHE